MKKILIIEDEQDIVEITTIILEEKGYEVSSLRDFNSYKTAINESCSDLVLLDLNLGLYRGEEICRYIKQQTHLLPLKVILMSANSDIKEVKEEVGADGFISKPFDIANFMHTIEKCIKE